MDPSTENRLTTREYSMHPFHESLLQSRRNFLATSASGIGMLALASLLREIATAIDEQDRLEEEANAASAQARFTSFVVLLLPLVAVVFGELAAPGMVGRIVASPLGLWLVGLAGVLQLTGTLLIRRLGRAEL